MRTDKLRHILVQTLKPDAKRDEGTGAEPPDPAEPGRSGNAKDAPPEQSPQPQ